MGQLTGKIFGAVASLSLLASAPAAATARAPVAQTSVLSPWVALSALGSPASSAALCANAAAIAATAAQAAAPGCVFPQVDVVPVPAEAGVARAPVAGAIPTGGLGFLPILLGLAAVAAGLAALAAAGDDDGAGGPLPPMSPS